MKEYIEWLERMIEQTREDKDLQREHWAFCQSFKKVSELAFHQCNVSGRSEQLATYLQDVIGKKYSIYFEQQDIDGLIGSANCH